MLKLSQEGFRRLKIIVAECVDAPEIVEVLNNFKWEARPVNTLRLQCNKAFKNFSAKSGENFKIAEFLANDDYGFIESWCVCFLYVKLRTYITKENFGYKSKPVYLKQIVDLFKKAGEIGTDVSWY